MYCSEKCKRFAANVRKREKYKNDENYRNNVKRSIKKYNASEVGKDKLQANKLKRDNRIKNGSKIDYITLRQLFKRDNGICWLCGKKCNYEDKQYKISKNGRNYLATGPNYPSVDHVIPLSKGGTHTWDNVKLAHKSCNSKKYNKIIVTAEFLS